MNAVIPGWLIWLECNGWAFVAFMNLCAHLMYLGLWLNKKWEYFGISIPYGVGLFTVVASTDWWWIGEISMVLAAVVIFPKFLKAIRFNDKEL